MRTVSWKAFCITFLLSIACFFFIDVFTIKTNHVSGNGNLGLPLYPLACFFLLVVMHYLFATYFNKLRVFSKKLHVLTIILAAAAIVVCLSFAREKFVLRIAELDRTMAVSTTFMRDHSWIDIHLNNLYFNVYTYMAAISLAFLLAGLYRMVRGRVK